jgi:hypothetical protein
VARPERLYKYQSVSARSLENLKLRTLWFSHPSAFNDPFDCAIQVGFKDLTTDDLERVHSYYLSRDDLPPQVRESLVSNSAGSPEFRRMIEAALAGFTDSPLTGQSRNLGVACFSAKNDDLLMWSHYADGHRGFCLEFDTSEEPFSKSEPVMYVDDVPLVNPVDTLDGKSTGSGIIDVMLRTKHSAWRYEQEWRVLHQEAEKSYVYLYHLLTGVYFGTSMPSGQRDVIAQLLLGSPTQLYQMVPGEKAFSLTSEPVEYTPYRFG